MATHFHQPPADKARKAGWRNHLFSLHLFPPPVRKNITPPVRKNINEIKDAGHHIKNTQKGSDVRRPEEHGRTHKNASVTRKNIDAAVSGAAQILMRL